ncbi:MAG: Zn-ribbon domain-containing OB-fold protein [Nitrososphaerales archaeon]|nr:Zn-ribbon domain-containing OB-fold protein [Nitrososphaerales archaeon]
MPLNERITSVDELRSWTDKIPFRYEYTAGVAGERFLRGLQEGKILAGTCEKCGKRYLPPKMYCVDCFLPITMYAEVGPVGTVTALTESHLDFQGKRLGSPFLMAFVTFGGVTGGIIHRVEGKGLKVGSKVEARFVTQSSRKGSLLDIEKFVTA